MLELAYPYLNTIIAFLYNGSNEKAKANFHKYTPESIVGRLMANKYLLELQGINNTNLSSYIYNWILGAYEDGNMMWWGMLNVDQRGHSILNKSYLTKFRKKMKPHDQTFSPPAEVQTIFWQKWKSQDKATQEKFIREFEVLQSNKDIRTREL